MDHPDSERLQLYVDQRLGEAERLAVDAHLFNCAACAEQLRGLRAVANGVASLKEVALPPEFATEMAEEVSPSEHLSVPPARRGLFLQAAICAAILAVCAALLLVVDTPVTDPADDVLGLVQILLGAPFDSDTDVIAVLSIMALAGLGVLAWLLSGMPRIGSQRRDTRDHDRRR
jgi:hypothetical protein